MEIDALLTRLPRPIKTFVGLFVFVLSVGYFTGLSFVGETTDASVTGIQENYLGNEEAEAAEVMKFKKTEREMLTIVHTHILSMSMLFFLLGMLVWATHWPKKLKMFLSIEPLLSVLLTFGGIYFLWQGVLWMRYLVAFSGILMTLSFIVGAVAVLHALVQKKVG